MPDVQVTNRNPFPLSGMFDNRGYVFPPNQPTSVPEPAARHIFALGQENKTGALNRLGLLKPGDTLEKANEALSNVQFVMGYTAFESPEPPMPQPQPEPDQEQEEADDDEIGGSPGAQRSPGGETEAGADEPVSAAGALARAVMRERRAKKLPLGG